MLFIKKRVLFCLIGLLMVAVGLCQTTIINSRTDQKRLKSFQNAKLGLFLHYLACYTPKTGDSWSIGRQTPKCVADSITLAWDPENFDPKKVVDFAVKAGCKYIVVVSKHHDGFSIWDSKFTDFDLQQLKFNRDII